MCPGCVLGEVEGQDMTTHGAGVEDMDGSDSDDDGEMDGGFESAEIFGEAAFIPHGLQRIPGLWEATNAEVSLNLSVWCRRTRHTLRLRYFVS
jgi:hypothetical protein